MKTRQQKVLAGIVGLIVVLFGWYRVVWSGQTAAIAKASAAKVAAEGETRKTRVEVNRLEQLKSDTSREAIEKKLSVAVPSEPDLANYLRWIKQLGADNHLDIPTVGHAEPTPPGGLASTAGPDDGIFEVSLTVQAMGEYADILNFVHAIETTDRLIVIDTVTLTKDSASALATVDTAGGTDGTPTPPSSASSSPRLSANITARMFSRHALDLAPTAAEATAAPVTAPASSGAALPPSTTIGVTP